VPAVLIAPVNISNGTDPGLVEEIGSAYVEAGATLLSTHVDRDHDRSVHTIAAEQGQLASALVSGAAVAFEAIDLRRNVGVHPRVGAVDVAPVVHVTEADRGAACAEALVLGDLLARTHAVPVFLYGALAGGRTRAELRAGGLEGLLARIEQGALAADFGPPLPGMASGATLVAARPPMVAFNLFLGAGVSLDAAKAVAAKVREGGEIGLPGVRALGLELRGQGAIQLSANLEQPATAGIAELHAAVSDLVPVDSGELIGLAPRAVLERIPERLAIPGLDPEMASIEGCLRFHGLSD